MDNFNQQVWIEPKSVYIIANASEVSGAGHVMRCLTIAKSFQELGHKSSFIADYIEIDWVKDRISMSGFNLLAQNSLKNDNTLNGILILDSYDIDILNQLRGSKNWNTIVQIVDPKTPIVPADIYISPNPIRDYRLEQLDSPTFQGIEFIPIRKEFLPHVINDNSASQDSIRILVSGGGSNVNGFVESTCTKLSKIENNIQVTALTSNNIIDKWKDKRFKTIKIGNLENINLSNFDIFLTTSGQSCWEFVSTRKTVGVAIGVSNQIENHNFLVCNELAFNLGEYGPQGWKIDFSLLSKVLAGESYKNISKSNSLLDCLGNGSELIAKKIIEFSF